MYTYKAVLVRVVDGDTVFLNVDLGFRAFMVLNFRLARINAPEMRGDTLLAGTAAKEELERLLAPGNLVVLSSKSDKYGRWLGEILVGGLQGKNVNDMMLANGFATLYK